MKAKQKQYAIGVDYGTNSVRALVVDLADGAELASATFAYPSGEDGRLALSVLVGAYISHEEGHRPVRIHDEALPRTRVFPWA